jgi:hypothetical protein
MTIQTEDYAFLADQSYTDWPIGKELQSPSQAVYVVFRTSSPNEYGYSGAIYQSKITGEIVVAH